VLHRHVDTVADELAIRRVVPPGGVGYGRIS
jgi:hypothetical protein